MIQIIVTLLPECGTNKYVYNAGNLDVAITLDRSLKASDTYTFLLYNEELMLLGEAETGDPEVEHFRKTFNIHFSTESVWMPGNYFLLLRNSEGLVLRSDFQLKDDGQTVVTGTRNCGRLSDEDILSGRLMRRHIQWRRLSQWPGASQLKRWVLERARANELNAWRARMSADKLEFCNNIILTSQKRSWYSQAIMLMKHAAELTGEAKWADCETFYDVTCMNPYEKMTDFFIDCHKEDPIGLGLDIAEPRYFIFKNIHALTDNGGKTMLRNILSHWPGSADGALFVGTAQEVEELMQQYPSLRPRFPECNHLQMQPLTLTEMVNAFLAEFRIAKLNLSPEALDKLCRLVVAAYQRGTVSTWDRSDIRQLLADRLQPLYCRHAIALAQSGRDGRCLTEVQVADLSEEVLFSQTNSYDEAIRELNAMVGLDGIKSSITSLSHRMSFYAMRRQFGLHTSDGTALHTILTGNPGTGKTTVARLLGKIYHALGLLSKGEVICVDRKRIIGRYIGETEENMKLILREAKGNVLFVDEAYTLYTDGDSKDFGRHAVECLLDVLSAKNPDMMVVFAGYQREMDALMSMNPGLVGRFPYRFHFSDYTEEQLMDIARRLLEQDQYLLTSEAADGFMRAIRSVVKSKSEHFSNARWVEQFIHNGIIPAMAERVVAAPNASGIDLYRTVEAVDVLNACKLFNPQTIDLRRRNAIGFCA